jgi:hypothetical protein
MVKKLDPHRYDQYQGQVCDFCGHVIDDPDEYLVDYDFDGLKKCCNACDLCLMDPQYFGAIRKRIRSLGREVPEWLKVYFAKRER